MIFWWFDSPAKDTAINCPDSLLFMYLGWRSWIGLSYITAIEYHVAGPHRPIPASCPPVHDDQLQLLERCDP